jgi:hypothetical protein
MKLQALIDEARLSYSERRDWANNLERAIHQGHSKRPFSDVLQLRARLDAKLALVRALGVIAARRGELPEDLILELEADPHANEHGGQGV